MNWIKSWIKRHSQRMLESGESLDTLSRGVAIGMFFGFTPLFGLKTVLSILVAWMFRGSKMAAVVAVALHDLILPLMPVILRAQYQIGYWVLSNPHQLPARMRLEGLHPLDWLRWTTFLSIGKPVLVGSLIMGVPIAFVFLHHHTGW